MTSRKVVSFIINNWHPYIFFYFCQKFSCMYSTTCIWGINNSSLFFLHFSCVIYASCSWLLLFKNHGFRFLCFSFYLINIVCFFFFLLFLHTCMFLFYFVWLWYFEKLFIKCRIYKTFSTICILIRCIIAEKMIPTFISYSIVVYST